MQNIVIELVDRLRSSMKALMDEDTTEARVARERARSEQLLSDTPKSIPDISPEIIAACITTAELLAPELAKCGKNTLKLHRLLLHLKRANRFDIYKAWPVWEDLLPHPEALCDRLKHDAGKKRKVKSMTVADANSKAMELAKRMGEGFFQLSERQQAKAIGCSWKTWSSTTLYKEARKRRPQPQEAKDKGAGRKVVTLTAKVEAMTGEGGRDEVLEKLIAQQEADYEPSPLEEDSPSSPRQKVRSYIRL